MVTLQGTGDWAPWQALWGRQAAGVARRPPHPTLSLAGKTVPTRARAGGRKLKVRMSVAELAGVHRDAISPSLSCGA